VAKKLRRGADNLKAKINKQFKEQIEAAKKAQKQKKEQEEAKKQELQN
jgi:hypothetical protein